MLASNISMPNRAINDSRQHGLHEDLPATSMQPGDPQISFEFFPPSFGKAEEKFWRTVEQLKTLNPYMVSVTYGADGSTQNNTYAVVKRLLEETDLTVAPHMTCVGASKGELRELAQQYWQDGVRHIVALRGDLPKSPQSAPAARDQYRYCSEFVEDLRKIADFDISVAAYPETHPEAASPKDDLENLRRKIDAGATRALTQFFFMTEHFLRFRDRCSLFDIEDCIVPGVLPVENFTQVQRFASQCSVEVPEWLKERFSGLEENAETRKLVAAAVAIDQVNTLRMHGVSQFHLYTLNRAELAYAMCHTLGLRPEAEAIEESTV